MTSNTPPIIIKTDDGTEAMRVDPTGKVGIGTATPTNPLHVNGTTGIRQDSLYLSGGVGGSSFTYNAHRNDANTDWVFPDPTHAAVTLEMDDWNGTPRFQMWNTTPGNPTGWVQRFAIDGNSGNVLMGQSGGNVGIGTTSPNNQLALTSQASFGGNTSNTGTEPVEVQGPGAGVSFYDRTGGATGRWVIYSDRTGGAGTETLRFWSAGDKVAIDQGGNVNCTSMQASNDAGFATGISSYGRFIGVNSRGTFGIQAVNFNNQNAVLLATPSQAGWFDGDVDIVGNISKSGGSFRIDHPLDPANKYLSHSFVESPDMKNIYDGVAVLDANGEAEIELPAWFETLNRDFRYQLTCIGGYAPVYIAEKVRDNRFKIAGGQPGLEVSWLVTGIRQDAWAKAHPIPVEEDKSPDKQGYYLHPELHGASDEKDIRLVLFPAEITQKM